MKSVIKIGLMIIIMVGLLVGCTNDNSDALKFKEAYEKVNGETNSKGVEYRYVEIDEDNPFIYIDGSELVSKIENKDTFIVYFGDSLCPWCRSVIEKFIEVAKEYDIDKVYYVDIWDDDHNEVLRDTYTLEDGKATLTHEGTDEYYELLEYFDELLDNYTLTDEDDKSVDVGEKRIFAPNFVYVKNGEAISLIEGISSLQEDAYEELSDDILTDEEAIFKDFIKESKE